MDDVEDMQPGSRLVGALRGWEDAGRPRESFVIGVLPGEGIGPEIIGISLDLLNVIQSFGRHHFKIRRGGKIGFEAEKEAGQALTDDVIKFCQSVFEEDGAIFCGAAGGRFVYELRRRFDLYCKIAPLRPLPALRDTGALRPDVMDKADILVLREGVAGLYQGEFGFEERAGGRRAYHTFHYDEAQIARILRVAISIAQSRHKRLHIVTKPFGAPSISELWRQQAQLLCGGTGIEPQILEVDNACYQIVAHPESFDVVVAPKNLGEIIVDTGSLLLGSRGMSYSANFSDYGAAVYQTSHGAAYDLAGTNRANPLGQILSLAMMLRESFGLVHVANHIEAAANDTLAQGWRTRDIMAPRCTEVGARELGQHVARRLHDRLVEPAEDPIKIRLRSCE